MPISFPPEQAGDAETDLNDDVEKNAGQGFEESDPVDDAPADAKEPEEKSRNGDQTESKGIHSFAFKDYCIARRPCVWLC